MENVDLRELALKKVRINGNVIGKFGTFEVEQEYKNNTNKVLEVGYTFPIVETATIVGFEIIIGDKVLKGKCKEKEKARKEYQKNIVKGNSAYMMEQETDNIFRISVGKIDKGEEVKLKIHYIDKFEITDNTIKILFPTLVTPRYKSNITSKLNYGKVDYTVDFNISVNKALNRKNIISSSHKINIIDDEKLERVEVQNYDLSKDFKLDIELKNELSSKAITSKTRDGKDMVYLSFIPEILDTYEDSEKEYLFIVDVSGSMSGAKIEETKNAVIECLKQLDIGDKFNIIPFESEFEAMNINSVEYNENSFEEAVKYVNNLRPLGGTEILNPIKFALYEEETDKIILLFTDGQVGNEDEIIRYVEKNINKSRIFPFGIDTNVNSAFIKQLAKVGNGKAELIQPKEKIDNKIIRTFARIQTPLIEDVEINYGSSIVIDEIKEENTLFNYEFFNVFTKLEKLNDDVQLKGKILNKEYVWKINKEEINESNVDLEVLFAKQEIERLEEYIRNTYDDKKKENYKKMIIELSEKYNINSKYTSFITIYDREKKLLEVPEYQETILSNKFAKGTILNKMWSKLGVNECEDFEEDYESEDISFGTTTFMNTCNDLEIPGFLRRNKKITSDFAVKPIEKTDRELLQNRVDNYYDIFRLKDKQSTLTYLLYSLYYYHKIDARFNYKELLIFLNNHKQEIISSELYMKLICLLYTLMKNDGTVDRDKLLNLIDDKFKKIIVTGLKVNVGLKIITGDEVSNIIKNNNIEQKIDDAIWYLYSYSGSLSWIK
ncbi:MAG: VWA domain-containing protein [Clostridia bacterium]|nr:VWA domain-containing protein [Clostridia bacterium]